MCYPPFSEALDLFHGCKVNVLKRQNDYSVSKRPQNIASLEFFIEVAMLVPLLSNSPPLSKLIEDSRVRIGRFSADREYNEMVALFVPLEGKPKDCCGNCESVKKARQKGGERDGFQSPCFATSTR
jgi:hypothetical protein